MKTIFVCIAFVISCASLSAQATWLQKNNFASLSRYGAVAFSIGNKGYVGTGFTNVNTGSVDFWEYDATNDSWAQKANFTGSPRGLASGCSVGSLGYVVLGRNGNNYVTDGYSYNPANNSWTAIASFPGTARGNTAIFSNGNNLYIFGGIAVTSQPLTELWEYNTVTSTWTQKTSMPGFPRWNAAGFSIGSYGYISCGTSGTSSFVDCWRYDPAGDTWLQRASLPTSTGRAAPGAFTIGSNAFLGTGLNSTSNFLQDFYKYDPTANTWTAVTSFAGIGRAGTCSFVLNGKGYFGLGNLSSGYTNDWWEFSPGPVGIEEANQLEVSIFPNPFSEFITIENNSNSVFTVNVYNTNGSCVFSKSNANTAFRIPCSHWANGNYIVEIISNNLRTQKQIVKQ